MKIMIDTNIFISAALFPTGKVSSALIKALSPPYQPITCDYIINELKQKFSEKFSDKANALNEFLSAIDDFVEIVPTPAITTKQEKLIRDCKDQPILRAALSSNADFLLTGDKDFLESSVTKPKIISVSEFLLNTY